MVALVEVKGGAIRSVLRRGGSRRKGGIVTPARARPQLNKSPSEAPPPSSTARVVSHVSRNAKRYAVGGGAVVASGAVSPKVGSQAGKQSVGQKDPHYNTNYRAGKATFADRDRKIRKSLGEAFHEALRSAKSLVTPERAAAGAAIGAGLAYVGSRAARGFKSGKQEKRQQGMAHGYEDAFKQRREAFDASDFSYLNKDQPTRKRREEDPFAEDALQEFSLTTGKQQRQKSQATHKAVQQLDKSPAAQNRRNYNYAHSQLGRGLTKPSGDFARSVAAHSSATGKPNRAPWTQRESDGPFAEDAAAGIKNKIGQAIEFRKQHKVKGVGGDAAVNAVNKINESELEEVSGYIRAGKTAAKAAQATRAGRVAAKAVPWTSRGLIATDIAVLGGGAAKAGYSTATKKPSERKEGARVSRVASIAGKSVRRGDPLIFGTGTALGVRAKGRDIHDDQKLNQSHIKNQK